MVRMTTDDDPFAIFTRAPPNETPGERAAREAAEAEAKKRSDAIDDELRKEKVRLKKEEKGVVKVLLLGQSESGKSTTLKNFRMKYARSEWEAELATWRTVVQLNLLKSIITILDTLQAEQDNEPTDDPPYTANNETEFLYTPPTPATPAATPRWDPLSTPGQSPTVTAMPAATATVGRSRGNSVSKNDQAGFRSLNAAAGANLRKDLLVSTSNLGTCGLGGGAAASPVLGYESSPTTLASAAQATPATSRSRAPSLSLNNPKETALQLTGKHQLLKLRLAPLRRVEQDLRRRLGASAEEEMADAAVPGASSGSGSVEYGPLGNITNGTLRRKATREFGVRRLKDALDQSNVGVGAAPGSPIVHGGGKSSNGHGNTEDRRSRKDGWSPTSDDGGKGADEATEVIASCLEDIRALWMDEVVRAVLRRRKIRLEDSAGFFLDDIDRIAQRTYTPSSDDVVRARLRTLGVQEYKVKIEQTGGSAIGNAIMNFGNEWRLYDVGGSRTGRNAWIPFFEGIHAIIFSLSCFDERLLEDSRINRLEDSFLLWRTVCSSRLLRKASLILFMNKCDLLRRKLKTGVKVKNFLPSYGDRPNDANTVVRYMKEKFKDIAKNSPEQSGRATYYYATSVTDTKTTAITLVAVKDIILREHLKDADFV